jgi:hypothetical protein
MHVSIEVSATVPDETYGVDLVDRLVMAVRGYCNEHSASAELSVIATGPTTMEVQELSSDLRSHGFKFVGITSAEKDVYAVTVELSREIEIGDRLF